VEAGPLGSEEVEIARACPVVMERAFVAVCAEGEVESVAWTVKLKVPAAVGVPLMTPLTARERPAGSDPEAMVQEQGVVPPEAVRTVE